MSNFKNFFPSKLVDGDFTVFVDVMDMEFKRVEQYIQQITTLTNIDRCPKDFLTSLGEIIDYRFYDELDIDLQREAIKYYLDASKEIGNKNDIAMMATYGDNPGYKGGNLFIPGTYIEKELASVIFPRDMLFTWSVSQFSGEHKLPDNIVYKEGTILIEVSNLNQVIMDRVETVKPVGMLVVYKYVKDGKIEYITHTRVLNN